jgi:hypothetical protein
VHHDSSDHDSVRDGNVRDDNGSGDGAIPPRRGSKRKLWQHYREHQPLRKIQRTPRQNRVRLQTERNLLMMEVADLDEQLATLTSRRIEALQGLDASREALWPRWPHRGGRQPPDAEELPMPPAHPEAIELGGRSLRSCCRAILRTHGRLQLRSLHALLHHYGYAVYSATPAKALADAMGHEVARGRVRRVARGIYEIDPDAPLSRWRADQEPDLVDPAQARDPEAWPGAPGTAAALAWWPPDDPPGPSGPPGSPGTSGPSGPSGPFGPSELPDDLSDQPCAPDPPGPSAGSHPPDERRSPDEPRRPTRSQTPPAQPTAPPPSPPSTGEHRAPITRPPCTGPPCTGPPCTGPPCTGPPCTGPPATVHRPPRRAPPARPISPRGEAQPTDGWEPARQAQR